MKLLERVLRMLYTAIASKKENTPKQTDPEIKENIEMIGVLPSPPDERDYTISQFVPGIDKILGEEFILPLPELQIILDQSVINSCCAHSGSTCNSICSYINTNKWIDYSPSMLYGDREDTDWQGMGMYASQMLWNLRHKGMWFRRDFDKRLEVPGIITEAKKAKAARPDLVKQALDYNITGYARMNSDNEIKAALKVGMPVTAGWALYSSFNDVKRDGLVSVPFQGHEKFLGNHQMTIVGWTNTDRWIVVNSYGTYIAHWGMYYIPFNYKPFEAWAISKTINPIKYKAKEVKLTIDDVRINIDGQIKEIDVPAQIINSRTYLPGRILFEALGASVEWIQERQEIIVRSEEAEIKLWIDNKTIEVNGKKIVNDAAPVIRNDRTLLPVRFVSEYLNCKVDWNETDRSITIKAL